MQDLIRPEIKEMAAYHVPEATGLVKLDAMENPFPWPEEMKQEWLSLMGPVELNRYPDPSAKALVSDLRACFNVDADAAVVLGNGSDELIQLILMALKEGSSVMAPTPSFVMYEHISKSLGLPFVGVPLADNFDLDVQIMLSAIKEHNPAVIFLAYPNNPTANLFTEAHLLDICRAANGLVVIDEAYQPFAHKTYINRIKEFDNVIVMRTVSKLGLAGIRLGFMVGESGLMNQFEKIRLPYNINVLTQLTASFAFKHIDVLDAQAALICEQRAQMLESLSALCGVQVFPSNANFILFSLLSDSSERVFEAFKESGVLIKKMGEMPGLPVNSLRVTVGSTQQNTLFIEQLSSILK